MTIPFVDLYGITVSDKEDLVTIYSNQVFKIILFLRD